MMYVIRERTFALGQDSDITDENGRTVFQVDGKEMAGDLLDHEFTIRRGDRTVATISKRWLSLRDTYAVEIAAGENELLILACALALDLAEDEERRNR